MIGVINPNNTQTLDVQLAYTENATLQLTPGDAFPSETGSSTKATSTPSSAAGSTSGGGGGGSSNSLSAGAIAGIAIGAAAVLVLAGVMFYLCGRRGGLDKAYNGQSRQSFPPAMVEAKYVPGGPKSPGQATYATTTYSSTPSNEPHRQGTPQYSLSGSPPPMSIRSETSYQHFGSPPLHQVGSPMMQTMEGGQGYM